MARQAGRLVRPPTCTEAAEEEPGRDWRSKGCNLGAVSPHAALYWYKVLKPLRTLNSNPALQAVMRMYLPRQEKRTYFNISTIFYKLNV